MSKRPAKPIRIRALSNENFRYGIRDFKSNLKLEIKLAKLLKAPSTASTCKITGKKMILQVLLTAKKVRRFYGLPVILWAAGNPARKIKPETWEREN